MKLRKRRISILLSMLLLLSVFQPAVALDVDPDFEQIYEIGTRLLGDIEHEKELYGLADVNFDNLYIGEYIPAYIAKETGLTLSNIRYYPVIENGEWVATLTCSKSNDIWNAQLSNTFVEELPEIGANDDLKLVFDSNAGYLSKNSAIHSLTSYNAVAERVNIASSPMTLSAADGQKLVNKRAVEIGKFDDNRQSRSSLPTQYYLNLPLVQQKQSMSCPLACLESIAGFFGKYYTQEELCDKYPIPGEVTLTSGATLHQLQYICAEIELNSTYYTRSNFSFNTLKSSIYNNSPLVAACTATAGSATNAGHAVAIRGYTTYTSSVTHVGSFAFMDPWDATYQAGSVSTGNVYEFRIVRAGSAYEYAAQQFLGVED